MAEFTDREHYIPLRKADLFQLLRQDKQLAPEEREPLSRLCKQVSAIYHLEYLARLEELKDAYAPFDPDSETRPLHQPSATERQKNIDTLFEKFIALMERGNFRQLKWVDVQAAMEGGSTDWGINMDVDSAVFERLEIFSRGDSVSTRTRRSWKKLWRKEEIKVPSYQRLVFIVKLRPHKRLSKIADTRHVFLKIFKDIPKLDMEMLLPGAKVQWPKAKWYTFWGLLTANMGWLLFKLSTQLAATILVLVASLWALKEDFDKAWAALTSALVVALGPVAILGGFTYRQYASYQTTKQNYNLMLTESLYYQNLDNNVGVLTRLMDEAEEQECREVLLGYYCLWKYGPAQGWTSAQLDDYVEMFLEGTVNLKVDFEIGDALDKLEKLRLVEKNGEHYRAVPLAQALQALERHWSETLRS